MKPPACDPGDFCTAPFAVLTHRQDNYVLGTAFALIDGRPAPDVSKQQSPTVVPRPEFLCCIIIYVYIWSFAEYTDWKLSLTQLAFEPPGTLRLVSDDFPWYWRGYFAPKFRNRCGQPDVFRGFARCRIRCRAEPGGDAARFRPERWQPGAGRD